MYTIDICKQSIYHVVVGPEGIWIISDEGVVMSSLYTLRAIPEIDGVEV